MKKLLIVLALSFAVFIILPGILYVVFFSVLAIGFTKNAENFDNMLANSRKIGACYMEYKGTIYYFRRDSTAPYKNSLRADASAFRLINGDNASKSPCLGTDGKTVFDGDRIIHGADPATFTVIAAESGNYLSRDKSTVFYNGAEIVGANPATFTIIDPQFAYTKDKLFVFYGGVRIPGMNPQGFTFLYDETHGQSGRYSKDMTDSTVYYKTTRIPADGTTFRLLDVGSELGADKNAVYYKENIVPDVDPATITILSPQGLIKDKSRVYMFTNTGGFKPVTGVQHVPDFRKYGEGEIQWLDGRPHAGVCGDGTTFMYCNSAAPANPKDFRIIR